MRKMIFKMVLVLVVSLMYMCDTVEPAEQNEPTVRIIIDYMYYQNGNHGQLYVKHNNEVLYVLEERDYDTLEVPLDWLEITWDQVDVRTKEIFPKELREYNIYGTMFREVDPEINISREDMEALKVRYGR